MKKGIHWFNRILLKYPIFIGLVVITFMVREYYPFSVYPMYNHFPNWSYTFYFKTEDGQNVGQLTPISHGDLSHLFFTECIKRKLDYGFGCESSNDLNEIGENMRKNTFSDADLIQLGIKELHLMRIYNHITEVGLVSDTITMNSYYVN